MNEITAGNVKEKKTKGGGGRHGGYMGGHGGGGSKLDMEKFEPLIAESSKVAVSVSHGALMEFLKKFMFAKQQGAQIIREEQKVAKK